MYHLYSNKGISSSRDKIVDIYALNMGVPKYIKPILTDLKVEKDSNAKIVGDFDTLLSMMDGSDRKPMRKPWI